MYAYGRASAIPGPKETLATGGARSGTASQGGAEVKMAGQGWVRAGEAVLELGAEVSLEVLIKVT